MAQVENRVHKRGTIIPNQSRNNNGDYLQRFHDWKNKSKTFSTPKEQRKMSLSNRIIENERPAKMGKDDVRTLTVTNPHAKENASLPPKPRQSKSSKSKTFTGLRDALSEISSEYEKIKKSDNELLPNIHSNDDEACDARATQGRTFSVANQITISTGQREMLSLPTSRRTTFEIPTNERHSSLLSLEKRKSTGKILTKKAKQMKYVESRISSGVPKLGSSKAIPQTSARRLSVGKDRKTPTSRRMSTTNAHKSTVRPRNSELKNLQVSRHTLSRSNASTGNMNTFNTPSTGKVLLSRQASRVKCNQVTAPQRVVSKGQVQRTEIRRATLARTSNSVTPLQKPSFKVPKSSTGICPEKLAVNTGRTQVKSKIPLNDRRKSDGAVLLYKNQGNNKIARSAKQTQIRNKMAEWQSVKDKTPSRYRHCRCFDVTSDAKTGPIAAPAADVSMEVTAEHNVPASGRQLYESVREELGEVSREVQAQIDEQIDRITESLNKGCPVVDLLERVRHLQKTLPSSTRSASLWVCKARLQLASGDNDLVMDTLERACRSAAQPRQVLHRGMKEIIKQLPDEPSTPLPSHTPTSTAVENEDTQPTGDMLPPSEKPPFTPRKSAVQQANVFESSAIKYCVRESTPVLNRLQSAIPGVGGMSPYKIITPVRRSTRNSLAMIPELLKEKDCVYSTLSELPPAVRYGALFQANIDLGV